jgi:glycosyltransferase involved in cell wall biosynthesis
VTRLLLVHNDYRGAEPSGENHVVRNEAAGLSSRGHEVVVWGPCSDEISSFTAVQKLTLPGRVVWSRAASRDLERVMAAHQPDLVHIHNTFPLISGSILGVLRQLEVPTVATLHNYRLLCAGGTLFRDGQPCHDCLPSSHLPGVRHGCYRNSRLATVPVALANALHRRHWQGLDALVTLSEAQRRLFLEAGFDPERVIVKPNFVPEVSGSGHVPPLGDGFVYAGRLAETKGIAVIIEAWERLAARGLHPHLTIVGSGPLDAEVRRFASRHRSVAVVGQLSRVECYEHIQRSRAVLAPSTWEETFGLVVVEAMMFGRPALAAAIGSFPDLVHSGHDGLLIAPGDPEALAGSVATLYRSAETASRLGAAARATYERRFRPEPNLELLEAIYDRVLKLDRRGTVPVR